VILPIARRAEADVTLLELLVADDDLRDDVRRCVPERLTDERHAVERAQHQVAHLVVLDVAGRRDDQVRRAVGAREIRPQPLAGERLDGFLRAEDRAAERMVGPEVLGEQLMDQIVGRILDHLDLFEDDLLFPIDVFLAEARPHDDVREDLDGERQMLVEHLDVVARVFLRRERVHLPADRIDRLRDVLGGARVGPLEQHVLDEVRDAALLLRLVARAARQPDADADRADMRHPLRQETETIGKHVANDGGLRHLMLLGTAVNR
jgi:hypothetical protein